MSVSATESAVIAVVFSFLFISGSVLNGFVILTCLKCRKILLSQPKDFVIISLAISDFVQSFFAVPLGLSSAVAREWLWGHPGCIWYGFITAWVGLVSITHLVYSAVERFITLRSKVPKPLRKRKTFQAIFASWLLTLLVCCFPLIGWSEYSFEGLGLHCSILWDTTSVVNLSFCLFLLIVFYLGSLGTILVCYVKIFIIVRRVYKNAVRMWGHEALPTKVSYMAQVKIAKQFVLMFAGFIIAWTPYAIMSLMILFFNVKIPLVAREYPSMFAKTAVIYNPIIYFFTYRKFRKMAMKAWI